MSTPKGTIPWNAGTGKGWTDKRGYRWIYVTENGKRRAKREHRHIMEQHIGRKLLPEEVVHHKNEDPSDNSLENLEIQKWSLHTADHSTGRRQTEYAKRTQSVIAEYREENKRLLALTADMLAALLLAEGRIALLLREFPETSDVSDHPVATRYVHDQIRAALSKAGLPH